MRADAAAFAIYNEAAAKRPRFVVRIGFAVDSLAITSHAGISGVTAGTVLHGLLVEPTVTTQKLKPDEAVAEIGSASFALVDGSGLFTSEIRERLLDGAGLRGKTVQFYLGYEGLTFGNFQLVATQIVSSVTYGDGRYQVQCLDIQRSLRSSIFDPSKTTLASTVLDTDTVINLTSSTGFALIPHGTSYSDAPSASVGYVKIKTEIIRYTGIAGNQLTGCTRAMFGTLAATYTVDAAVAAERREKVTEYIYLELPAVKLAYAVLTGFIYGNLLGTSGGFEVDTNADGLADNWALFSNVTTPTRVAGRLTSFAQRVLASGGSAPRFFTAAGIYIAPGTPFTVSAWYNAVGGETLRLEARGYVSEVSTSITGTYAAIAVVAVAGWQRLSVSYVSLAAGPYIRPTLGLNGTPAAGTPVVVDDVMLELGDTAHDYTEFLGAQLPDHYHLGIASSLVRGADFTGIGSDLWNPADDSAGFILRFEGLTKQDGKRFLEKEVYLATGLFSPVYSDGTLGLRRMVRLLKDSAAQLTLDPTNCVSAGELQHDMKSLHNVFVVNWSWNGTEFRRANSYVDAVSAARHGEAETFAVNFKGLHGGRHTDGIILSMLDMLRDRYAGPPLRLSLDVLPSLNRLEVGDVVRVRLPSVRDYAAGPYAATTALDRAFEIQNVSADHKSGSLSLELFGSTADPAVTAPTTAVSSLPDAFYTAAGTQLSTVPGVVIGANIMTAAPATPLAGNAVLTAAGAVYYHNGDLTINAGVNLLIAANVQLRVKGFLTVNGTINGVGRGLPGVADDSRVLYVSLNNFISGSYYESIPGNPGYVGSTRSADGVLNCRSFPLTALNFFDTWPGTMTVSRFAVAPRLMLSVSGSTLVGLPADLRGSGGAPGGRLGVWADTPPALTAFTVGGSGAAGGAGLAIVCRGMAFGLNGYIDLSGADSAATAGLSVDGVVRHAGPGAPGGPGTLLLLLDGGALSVPDLAAGKYRAKVGTTTITGNPLPRTVYNFLNHPTSGTTDGVVAPLTGYLDPEFVSTRALDMSGAALLIQYIPAVELVTADQNSLVAPITSIATEAAEQGINVTLGGIGAVDSVELYMSSTNDRANATLIFEGLSSVIRVRVPDGATRYFWARTKLAGVRSTFFPVSAVAGVSGTAVGGLICRGNCEAFDDGVRKNGGVNVFDSDAYSPETFANGIFVSWQCAQVNAGLMVGLNSDPSTDSNYTSLDYAWYCRNNGQCYASESSVLTILGTYTVDTTFGIKYDGQVLQYLLNGVVLRAVTVAGLALFVDSSFSEPGGAIRNLKYGPMATGLGAPWVPRGNCVATLNTITKVGGAAAFDSDCYSQKLYESGCVLSFQPSQTNAFLAVGLNTDPTTDQSYTSLDHAFYLTNAAGVSIYESNVLIGTFGTYTVNTVFVLKYDGQQVQYLINGVVVRTVQLRGALFFMDSSFSTPGGAIRNVEFGPLTTAAAIPWVARGNCTCAVNTFRKVGGATAYDSDVYSLAAYDACSLTFQPSQASGLAKEFAVGLNTDPTLDQNYTSIDYCFRLTSTQVTIYESGVLITAPQTGYAVTDVLAIKYDGELVRYYVNGVLVRSVADPGKKFFLDSSFQTADTGAHNVEFAGIGNAAAVPFAVSGACMATSSTIRKVGGTTGWNAQAYSVEAIDGACQLSFQAVDTTSTFILGLNTDPLTSASYTDIDFSFYLNAAAYSFYESNVNTAGGAFTANTVFAIAYDGQQVSYSVDGVVVRTVQNVFAKRFYLDSSFNTSGSSARNVKFQALTPAASIPWIARSGCVATATTIKKIGGTNGNWDSDCYSAAAYRDGCVLSFQVDTTTVFGGLAIGLNTDPTLDQSYTSLDHAFYLNASGALELYESNVSVLNLGTTQWDSTTTFAIVYDGSVVRYLRNGSLLREKYSPSQTFYMDASFKSVGAQVRALSFGPTTRATPVQFFARTSQCTVSDTSAVKIAGATTAWDADVISIVGYPRCYMQFKASQQNLNVIAGLNSDPYTDSSYTSIDASWYPDSGGFLSIYEAGASVLAVGTYTTATLLGITYDGTNVRYYKDGVLIRTTALAVANMFFDSSFHSAGAAINSMEFGPGTVFPRTDTADISPNAVTEIVAATSLSETRSALAAGGAVAAVLDIAPAVRSYDYLATAIATFDAWCSPNAGVAFVYVWDTVPGSGLAYGQLCRINSTASYGDRLTCMFQVSVPANAVRVFTLAVGNLFIAGPDVTAELRNVSFRVELIKK